MLFVLLPYIHILKSSKMYEYLTLNAALKPKLFENMDQAFPEASFVSEKQNLTLLVFVLEAGHLHTRLSQRTYGVNILK